jgi:hypothetical protein
MAAVTFNTNRSNDSNYTIVQLTLNSNRRILTPQAFEDFQIEMGQLFEDTMPKYSDYLFGNNRVIKSVSVESFGIEVGPVQKRGHVHMTVKIEHRAPNYSVRKLNKRFKDWLNSVSGTRGWAVYGVLSKGGAQLNYDNKRLRQIANARVVNTGFEAEEIDRLSDMTSAIHIV